jgi:phospholipid/cholesterol/gamma-HCH transport system ATP-binding protein
MSIRLPNGGRGQMASSEKHLYSPNGREEFLHYIEFRNVYKTFDRPVLKGITFYVDAGQTLAVIGRSGVGKSVSLNLIMGFLKPDRGRIIVAHTDISTMSEEQLWQIRRKVTMVFQSGALFDSLTVGENIAFALEACRTCSGKSQEEMTRSLLKRVDLEDVQNAYPSDLATGYKRTVAIARALAAQPDCILYDEPTTMVDPIMSDHLSNLMLRLKKDMKLTAVVVTHDLDLMRKVADSVVFLYNGDTIYFGPVNKLETCDHPHVKQFLAMDRVEIVGKIKET